VCVLFCIIHIHICKALLLEPLIPNTKLKKNLTSPYNFAPKVINYRFPPLRQLLLDEERPEVRKLPCTCDRENKYLHQCPFDRTGIRRLRLISEFSFSFSLENLLPSNILQPGVQIPNLLHDIFDLALIGALDLTGLSNSQVKTHLHAAHGMAASQPP